MGVRVTAGIHETEPTDLQSRRSPGVRQIHLRDHSGDALFRHFKELASAQNRRYNARNWSLELTNKMLKIHVFFQFLHELPRLSVGSRSITATGTSWRSRVGRGTPSPQPSSLGS